MSDDVNDLIESAAGGAPESDAADAIISPELLAEVRASGTKVPPKATRRPDPDSDDDGSPWIREGNDGTDDGDNEPARSRPRRSKKWAGYLKHEVEAEADRLAQELQAARDQLAQQQTAAQETVSEDAIRDLAFSIKFCAGLGFKAAAIMRGPHWEISEPEADNIAETGAIALGPYAKPYAHMLPWLNFAAALGIPISARIAEDRRIRKLNEFPPDAT